MPVETVAIHQTHVSVVFLAGPHVYKIKKPVSLGFLDFSTLEKRQHFCEEEVRLNRRLAPAVYLGVVPITREGSEVRVGGSGAVIEWAVKMKRCPPRPPCCRVCCAKPSGRRWWPTWPVESPRFMRGPNRGRPSPLSAV